MLVEQTMEKLVAMKLHGAAEELRRWLQQPKEKDLTPADLIGLLVDAADGPGWPDEGVIALGGEMRAGLVRKLPAAEEPQPLPDQASPLQRFKIVLLTPAWFAGGREPQGGDWSTLFGVSAEVKLACVAMAIGRPLYFGGWDAAKGGHKTLRGFVPPGSVYYFEAEKPAGLPDAFTETPDGELSFSAQGLGAFVAGSWDWQK